jgi:hypothetical protein
LAATHCGPSGQPGIERCVTGLPTPTLLRMHQRQEASNWCWAAAVSMLLQGRGVQVSQGQVVQEHLGRTDNVSLPLEELAGLVDRRWQDAQGRTARTSVAPLPAWRLRLGLLAAEVLDDLALERPVLLAVNQHTLLLVQVVYDRPAGQADAAPKLVRAVVLDPASSLTVRSLRPGESQLRLLARVQVDVVPARPETVAGNDVVLPR